MNKIRASKTAAPKPSRIVSRLMERAGVSGPKIFVIDTNVFMHDPTSIYRFEEHDVFVPMMTLEELDAHKKGSSEVERNARQTSRIIDELVSGCECDIKDGIGLTKLSGGLATGRLFLQTDAADSELPASLPTAKADNQIIAVVKHLSEKFTKHQVILVSKDINMRIKARALGLQSQDYFNDKVLEDTDLLYAGFTELQPDFWDTHGKNMKSWKEKDRTWYQVQCPPRASMFVNEFVYLEARGGGGKAFYAIVRKRDDKKATLSTIVDYGHAKNAVSGIVARNREQNFALNLLMDPEIDFVTLLGQAGTGKTLITLAAAVAQAVEAGRYSEIIVTRVTVPVGEDIGFLPGSEEEKMTPWMGAFDDNIEVIAGCLVRSEQRSVAEQHGKVKTDDKTYPLNVKKELIRSRIKIKSLNFMRGRTFLNKFLIIDESQNLTPKQMKTLITRAGPGTKVVCLGNLGQIDTPYLTEGSSGLTYVVDRFKGWAHGGHITLQRGERSRLADYAGDVL